MSTEVLAKRFIVRLGNRLPVSKAHLLAVCAGLSPAAASRVQAADAPGGLGAGATFFYELQQAKGERWMTVANVQQLFADADLLGDWEDVVGAGSSAPPPAGPRVVVAPAPTLVTTSAATSTATTAIKILLLVAAPSAGAASTGNPGLTLETFRKGAAAAAKAAIKSRKLETAFDPDAMFVSELWVTAQTIGDMLREHQPTIVQFLSHGGPGDGGGEDKLFFPTDNGGHTALTGRFIKKTIQYYSPGTRGVVLSACYSDGVATAMLADVAGAAATTAIDWVVVSTGEIQPNVAQEFAGRFYSELAQRKSPDDAFHAGKLHAEIAGGDDGEKEAEKLQLRKKTSAAPPSTSGAAVAAPLAADAAASAAASSTTATAPAAASAPATPTSTVTTYQDWQAQQTAATRATSSQASTDTAAAVLPPVVGTLTQVEQWYAESTREPVSPVEMPHVAAIDVAMTSSMHGYIKKKFALPAGEADFAMALAHIPELQLKVIGMWEDHFPKYCRLLEWHLLRKPVTSQVDTEKKPFYGIRPSLVIVDSSNDRGFPQGKPFYVLLVTPGRDYLLQYGHMLRLLVAGYRGSAVSDQQIEVWHYPRAAAALGDITAFREVPPLPGVTTELLAGATVILGYVEKFAERFDANFTALLRTDQGDRKFVMTPNRQYGYRSYVVIGNGHRLVLLGVRHPYWGDIAGQVAVLAAQAGAKCLLYAAKCGTMSNDIKIYETPIIPSQYAELEPVVDKATNTLRSEYRPVWDVTNVLARLWTSQLTGTHVSVPTVTGETFALLRGAGGRGCTSIDNELGRMAAAIARLPAAARPMFGSVHFATDHVRNEREVLLRAANDLERQDKDKRDAVLAVLADRLAAAVVHLASSLASA